MDQTTERMGCDLHSHTQASDGMNRPSENVQLAFERGLGALAITDHDTVAGVEEALQAGERLNMVVVPGVEISTMAGGTDIHVLGYYVDYRDPVFLERLAELRRTREQRNERIIDKLQELGIELTMEDVIKGLGRLLEPDESIGRPHIADALVLKGHALHLRDAFDRYLAQGAAAYVPQPRIQPKEACEWIREAGGVPVLAHPGLYGDDGLVREVIQAAAFKGIEVYHSDHEAPDELRYLAMAKEYGLIVTAGSDYHGVRQGQVFHGDIGSRQVPMQVLEQLQQARTISS
ncbi:PHP domain-containing protein [Paenibacillus glucanolyticus]|jgi:predicted metal-dependent phosphoesterase TrpH|uniref:PHP domain-containing protein n=1 Tax=Paenibacillus TaxID=44249 RepID=UPI0003E1E7B5|nr:MULTISPECIES: PHP domain-containing protein [Paenibacillus]ANA81801.1 phosphatase [Paenibacillus glucanolyticus]AVV59468.1 PHP domain-containing protein [Paenibacillus glucanolyticus]ETT43218.1 PHP domain-containing protein [Paenibacillus sp. FSL R5-808]MPY16001.1 PHP domain-containing protein [Paenibacillus glucanolyticus]